MWNIECKAKISRKERKAKISRKEREGNARKGREDLYFLCALCGTSLRTLRETSLKLARIAIFSLWPGIALAQNIVPDNVERAALLALYTDTDGANWTESARWTVDQINGYPDSVLVGVNVVDGDIAGIQLDGAALNGTLPEELNDLTELVSLQIRFNNSSLGALPSLGALTNLKTLDFMMTDLSGTIPEWLGDLTNLEILNLSSNPGTGTSLSGPIPHQIGELSNLRQLYLNYNDLSQAGSIPDSLSFLDNLLVLELQNCQLDSASVGSGLSGLTNLQTLNLSGNPSFVISDGTFPDVLYSLPNLGTLYLRNINLQRLPDKFDELPMTYLDLSSNIFSDTARLRQVIDTLKNCASVETLLLMQSSISALPSNFKDLTTVESLYLSNNPIKPDSCEVLGEMTALKNLYLLSCDLTDIPSTLVNVITLEGLYLTNNNISDVPTTIRDIPDLKVLHLGNNDVSILPSWFGTGSMISLETLVLDNNQLETLPDSIINLANLVHLSIASNQLDGTWPANFENLQNIETLRLQNNNIITLPDMSSWASLKEVQLQNNELSGAVPAFLTNATSLKTLVNFSFNNYEDVDSLGHYNGSAATVILHNNHFTFADLLPLKPPPSGSYDYSPQPDTVDQVKEVYAYSAGILTLVAAIDTATSPASRYQWFRYVDGVNDEPLNATPSSAAYRYTVGVVAEDQGSQYYYKITNPSLSQLTLVSHMQTLVIVCELLPTNVDFASQRYLCAMKFFPQVTYPGGCRTTSYSWNFGDTGSSPDKSPLHAYDTEDTYDVTMSIQYTCGICVRDTAVTKQVTYVMAEDVLMDSLVSVPTDIKQEVLSAAATTFSDSWPLQHPLDPATSTGFYDGSAGVWRNEGTYVYDVPRHASSPVKISEDGTFDLEQFNWEHAQLEAIPNWIKANTMTEYSPFSYELENRDVLGLYSAALYDYGGHLPSANGVNMRNREMAFTGFEFMGNRSSGNWIFGEEQLPSYYLYDVYSGNSHIAIVKASQEQLVNVTEVDVSTRMLVPSLLTPFYHGRSRFITNNEIVCVQPYPNNPAWSMIVLRRAPYPGLWTGTIKVRNQVTPVVVPELDTVVAHTGISSLKISSEETYAQQLLQLDSGKTYLISAWVSVNDPHIVVPKLADSLGYEVILRDKNNTVVASSLVEPSGKIIEGWQQVKGTFVCPDKFLKLEIKFRPGSTGTSWYDDLRLHPQKGNMKSYVYDLKDYRLRAILDEENFATLFYYDQEGNLYLTKKETEDGVKTISENVSYMVTGQ